MVFEGKIKVSAEELNLDLTLLGGQSFRWSKVHNLNSTEKEEWHGVAYNGFWILSQVRDRIVYKIYPLEDEKIIKTNEDYKLLLEKYFRLHFKLKEHVQQWRNAHHHFDQMSQTLRAVRVLDQEPLENIVSFMCSQNNNIKRISSMIQWFCRKYGERITVSHSQTEYSFPTLQCLEKHQTELESEMRTAKFGYRAKFIANTLKKIIDNGGDKWFQKLRSLSYEEARLELVTLPGIGFKVADCICLMSLNHLQSVPIDTHIFKIAQSVYMPELSAVKTVTPAIYTKISKHFYSVYGRYAGWAQAVLFCSQLPQFKDSHEISGPEYVKQKKLITKSNNIKNNTLI